MFRLLQQDELHWSWQAKQERRCAYKRKIKAPSRNNFSCGKAVIIYYFERVSVALDIQHAKRMRRIGICGLSGSAMSPPPPHIII
jgi:hypothetical protein